MILPPENLSALVDYLKTYILQRDEIIRKDPQKALTIFPHYMKMREEHRPK